MCEGINLMAIAMAPPVVKSVTASSCLYFSLWRHLFNVHISKCTLPILGLAFLDAFLAVAFHGLHLEHHDLQQCSLTRSRRSDRLIGEAH